MTRKRTGVTLLEFAVWVVVAAVIVTVAVAAVHRTWRRAIERGFEVCDDGTLTGYYGYDRDGVVKIPGKIRGVKVRQLSCRTFVGLRGVRCIVLSPGITNIEEACFERDSNVTNVLLPEGLTRIGSLAFCDCQELPRLVIPSSLNYLGDKTFYLCTNLTSLCFMGNAPVTGANPFECCPTNLVIYHLPNATGWGTNFCGRPTAVWTPPGSAEMSARGRR